MGKKKVVVGMSGGVDSSVAAFLLKKQGYEVIGVTMQMWQEEKQADTESRNAACGLTAAEDAARVAQKLDIPYYVLDFRQVFQKHVVDYFAEEYLRGRTPNPCNACNRFVKWAALLEQSAQFGAEYIATGHYARIDRLPNKRLAIRSCVTAAKDQTYALYNLTQEQLSKTLLPVGNYEKQQIRQIALEQALPVAQKKDSQDICFIPDGDYGAFLERQAPERIPGKGCFVTRDGVVLGEHQGIIHYTIGQRKGLGLAMGHPVFVTEIRADANEVVIGENEELFKTQLLCDRINFMGIEDIKAGDPLRCRAKVRYAHRGTDCLVERVDENRLRVTFDEPVRAITPGQAVVFYDGEYVLGGGSIL